MNDESNKNLTSLLNDDIEEDKKENKSIVLYLFLFVFIIFIIYISIFFNYEDINKPINIKKDFSEQKFEKINVIEKMELTKTNAVEKTIQKKSNIKKIAKQDTKINKKSFFSIYHSQKQKVLKCYDYKSGSINPSKKCMKDIDNFLIKNKNALRYQIISVIADDDIKQYTKYTKHIQELIINGLSTKRVIEVSWYMKKVLGENNIITANNYFVKSKKKNKGIIIKAYY